MKSLVLAFLTLPSSFASAHTARLSLMPWDQIQADIVAQIHTLRPYTTAGWAPILGRIAARPLSEVESIAPEVESALRDFVYQQFAAQGLRVEAGQTLWSALENLFTDTVETSRAGVDIYWRNHEAEFQEFEKRRLSIQGRDTVIAAASRVPADQIADARGLALVLEVLKPGFLTEARPELARRFLTANDRQMLIDARRVGCALALAGPARN